MTETKVPARDSSLQDRKAPGNVTLTHLTAPRVQCSADTLRPPVVPSDTSALRDTAVWRGGVLRELLGQFLDPLSRCVEGGDHGILRCLRAHVVGGTCILQGGPFGFDALQSLVSLRQFVGDHQSRHNGQTRVADFAELAAQRDDALVKVAGELLKMGLLPVLACHAELAAVDCDVHMRHGDLASNLSIMSQL